MVVGNNNQTNPAECMENEDLGNGWIVQNKITSHPTATGGHFSVGYKVSNAVIKKEGFLKAFDFSAAFSDPDFPRAIQALAEAYNFERDVLEKCGQRKMNRVLVPLADGVHRVQSIVGMLQNVHYLIFDMAEGDIRKYRSQLQSLDLAWCLRSLQHAAMGLRELHSAHVVHQDLKPSNVLTFGGDGAKLADLGRSFDSDKPAAHDSYNIPGDKTYAPPEVFYRHANVEGIESRKAIDAFSLGSLIFFHFLGISASQGINGKLRLSQIPIGGTDFQSDLPYIQVAFRELVDDLKTEVKKITTKLDGEIVGLAVELCEPDPSHRGSPRFRAYKYVSSYTMEPYISKFNILAKKVEMGLA